MKRTLQLGLAVAAVTAALTAPASAAAPALSDRDVQGPACLDVLDGRLAYSRPTRTLTATLELAGPACAKVTYTLLVEENGVLSTYTATTFDVNGNPVFTVPTQGSEFVCVSATTSIGRHVFDRAPDGGCIEVSDGGDAPGLRMR